MPHRRQGTLTMGALRIRAASLIANPILGMSGPVPCVKGFVPLDQDKMRPDPAIERRLIGQ